ncbi:MAG TPA: PKD domain-containing protein [Conexibacter sp.]|nr:PKD domain-containing protein [Conexibacter sp.]
MRPLPFAAALAAIAVVLLPAYAGAVISAATTIDGPSGAIVGFDGIAMAQDGTGGLVYRKRVGGRVHVFASRFVNDAWQPPQRVDVGQPFDSSWPAIGAGNGGRLVVTWIHQFGAGVQDRMYSASLDPGARTFQAPVAIDLDVREGLDAAPSLSMERGGVAYLVYRVVYQRQSPDLPPGTVDADYRLQRYSGSFWSLLGQPVDRTQSQPQATPTPFNGPQVATDANGNAVVAWQEPDDALIPRIYARRVFGQVLGDVLPASPTSVGGVALHAAADQLSLAVSPFGEAIVGMRQQPDPHSPWHHARALVNMLPSSFADGAGTFIGARPVDGGGGDGPAGSLGPVSVATDDAGVFDAGFGLDARALDAGGDEGAVDPPVRLDDGSGAGGAGGAAPLVARGSEGTLAAAWTIDQHGSGGAGLLERRADGTPFQRIVSAPAGGVVQSLRLSGSDLGSALAGFEQGRDSGAQIVAASIEAPPGRFTVLTPAGWTRRRRVRLSWDPAPSTTGAVTYDVQVDGEDVASGLTRLTRTLGRGQLDDGSHEVTVVADDALGQSATSVVSTLKVDRRAPRVRIARLSDGRVRVRVRDGARGDCSGVASVAIAWGDGTRSHARRATHRYTAAGPHRLTVSVRDRVGNKRRIRKVIG